MTFKLLILGGSTEGFALAEALADWPGFEMITSFAGRTKTRRSVPGRSRVGGFGGAGGLADYFISEKIDALIDATHPFADKIKLNADKAGLEAGVNVLHIMRPPWQAVEGDDWQIVADMDEAARMIPAGEGGAGLVFLTIGRTELAPFAKRDDIRCLARIIDPPEPGTELGNIEILQARGPFDLQDERQLLAAHNITCLVTKNSGGDAASAKLQAAREAGIKVIMVKRPAPPAGNCVSTIAQAVSWLEGVQNEQN